MSKALILSEISRFITSRQICCTEQAKDEFLAELFLAEKQSWFFDEMPTYQELSEKACKKLAEETNIPLTVDYEDEDIDIESIAYYRIKGMIMGESSWWFSTKEFIEHFQKAEANPMIMAHFIHANSGGGDTWMLDEAFQVMAKATKPIVTIVERVAASACLYLVCASSKIYAATQNEIIGSIGTMVGFWNIDGYFESMGAKKIEEYATKSDRKNKKYNDLIHGKPEQFITEELDPLQQQFEAAVRKARPKAGALPEDHPLFRGETFSTQAATDLFVIDGQKSFNDALQEAYNAGQGWVDKKRKQRNALNIFNSY